MNIDKVAWLNNLKSSRWLASKVYHQKQAECGHATHVSPTTECHEIKMKS